MQIEDQEYAAFMRRVVRAFVRRAGNDPEALRMLVELGRYVDEAVTEGIKGAHDTGYSYGEIAARLGITRQAVHQRILRQRRIDDSSPTSPNAISAI